MEIHFQNLQYQIEQVKNQMPDFSLEEVENSEEFRRLKTIDDTLNSLLSNPPVSNPINTVESPTIKSTPPEEPVNETEKKGVAFKLLINNLVKTG